jgi:hypothetical protein
VEAKVDLPDFVYSGLGTFQSLGTLTTTETGTPRYIVEGRYWGGSSWDTSDGSYDQASPKATVNTNIASLDVAGETNLSVSVVFPAGSTQNNIDDLSFAFTGQDYEQEGTATDTPGTYMRELESFAATINEPSANEMVGFIMRVDGVDMYYSGGWTTSDGTLAQSNDAADINTNAAALLAGNASSLVQVKAVLDSSDGNDTPTVDEVTFTYQFGAVQEADPDQTSVYGYLEYADGTPIVNASVTFSAAKTTPYVRVGDRTVVGSVTVTSESDGFFTAELYNSPAYYKSEKVNFKYNVLVEVSGGDCPILDRDIELNADPTDVGINITTQLQF